jgi:hypothetical protein
VNEHILAAIVTDDEAEALLRIEEFDDALAFADDLRRHAAASATTSAAAETAASATAEAAATATAEAIAASAVTAAATTAEAITAPAVAATAATIAAATTTVAAAATKIIAAEAVALILAAALTAPPSIETHAVQIFPKSPQFIERPPTGRCARVFRREITARAKESP